MEYEPLVDDLKELIRNSYSKTDHDAIFMRMKEDVMGNRNAIDYFVKFTEELFDYMKKQPIVAKIFEIRKRCCQTI